MPYIKKTSADEIEVRAPVTPGELNYVLSEAAAAYLWGKYGRNPSYAERSEVHSQLQNATNEFQRRILDPYEDNKIADKENVDPYAIFE